MGLLDGVKTIARGAMRVGGRLLNPSMEYDPNSGLSEAQWKALNRQAAIARGTSLLTPGSSIAQGYQAGNAAFSQGLGQQMQLQQIGQQREDRNKVKADEAAVKGILGKIGPDATPDQLRAAVGGLLQGGFIKDASQAASILGDLKSQVNKMQQTQVGSDVTTFNPETGLFRNPKQKDPNAPDAWVQSIERGLTEDEKAEREWQHKYREAQLQDIRERVATSADARQAGQQERVARAFDSRTKNVRERLPVITQALRTLTDAVGNPLLSTSAVANFIQAADQRAQIRWQILNYFAKNVDGSLAGRWDLVKERLTKGTIPADKLLGLRKHLSHLLDDQKEIYNKQRSAEIKRHPGLSEWLPEVDEYMSDDWAGTNQDQPAPSANPFMRQ